jgi:replication factor A1
MGGAGPAYGMGGGGGGGPVAHSNEPLRIVPIKGLNPYQSRWTIKARVTQKSDVRK